MTRYVLDASVAAKWCLPDEPYRQQANLLFQAHRAGTVSFLAPDFFWIELANVLWKAVRRQNIAALDAQESLEDLAYLLRLPTTRAAGLREDALSIALRYGCSVYDAAYLALAACRAIH